MTWNLPHLPWWLGKWVFLLRDRKRRVLTAAEFIGHDFAFNAEIVEHYEKGSFVIVQVGEELVITSWEQYQGEAFAFERKHPGLWHEVIDVYAHLQRTVSRGAAPPQSVRLAMLAKQFDELTY